MRFWWSVKFHCCYFHTLRRIFSHRPQIFKYKFSCSWIQNNLRFFLRIIIIYVRGGMQAFKNVLFREINPLKSSWQPGNPIMHKGAKSESKCLDKIGSKIRYFIFIVRLWTFDFLKICFRGKKWWHFSCIRFCLLLEYPALFIISKLVATFWLLFRVSNVFFIVCIL